MTELPIIFSGPMVRAILEDRKTQTRRIVKIPKGFKPDPAHRGDDRAHILATVRWYAQPRDTLWVRETFCVGYALGDGSYTALPFQGCEEHRRAFYRATSPDATDEPQRLWKPAIHMPRWACRLRLHVYSIRVERLQDITAKDAIAEGCEERLGRHVPAYIELWNALNEKRGFGWNVNPWVWVVEFKRA